MQKYANAKYIKGGLISAGTMTIPPSTKNRHYQELMKLVAAGEVTIAPYVEPDKTAEFERRNAEAYLDDTNWYVIRQIEKGTPIPSNISTARDEARAKAGRS